MAEVKKRVMVRGWELSRRGVPAISAYFVVSNILEVRFFFQEIRFHHSLSFYKYFTTWHPGKSKAFFEECDNLSKLTLIYLDCACFQ